MYEDPSTPYPEASMPYSEAVKSPGFERPDMERPDFEMPDIERPDTRNLYDKPDTMINEPFEKYDRQIMKPKKNKTKKKRTKTYYFEFEDEYYYGKLEKPIKKNDKKAHFCALGKAEQVFKNSKMKTKKIKFHIPIKKMNKKLDVLIEKSGKSVYQQPEPMRDLSPEPMGPEPMGPEPMGPEPMTDLSPEPVVPEPREEPMGDLSPEPMGDLSPEPVEEPVVEPVEEPVEEPSEDATPSIIDNVTNLFTPTPKQDDAKGGTKKRRNRKNKSKKRA